VELKQGLLVVLQQQWQQQQHGQHQPSATTASTY
jgi:hypothetical protein